MEGKGNMILKFDQCKECEKRTNDIYNCIHICDKPFEALEKFNKYKKLEKQGRLLKLPCAEVYKSSGDYVYYIFEDEIVECINCGVQIEADGNIVFTLDANEKIFPYRKPDSENDLSPEDWCEETITLSVCEWGKTVFLIREEAALKLKKG